MRRTATLDLEALKSNLSALLERDDSFVLDARADAYGHGSAVIDAALDVGVGQILVSPDTQFSGSRFVTSIAERKLVAAEAYGLDGSGTPVMTLAGEVIAVKRVEAGTGVSYGYSYRTTAAANLALVGLGYADGVPWLASNRAQVLVAGGFHTLAGRIAMDQFVADCGSAQPEVGEDVVLFGNPQAGHPSAVSWGIHTERTPLELTAGLGRRVKRVVV